MSREDSLGNLDQFGGEWAQDPSRHKRQRPQRRLDWLLGPPMDAKWTQEPERPRPMDGRYERVEGTAIILCNILSTV